jgi:hypothetical protein
MNRGPFFVFVLFKTDMETSVGHLTAVLLICESEKTEN